VTRRLLAIALAVALAGACGDDSVDPEADADAAQRAVDALIDQLEDDGFVEGEQDDDEDDLEFESEDCQQFAAAFPEDDELPGETASEETGQFDLGEFEDVDGGTTSVEATVAFTEDTDAVEELFELFGDERLDDCLVEAIELSAAELAADDPTAQVGDIAVDDLDPPSVGDQGIAMRIEADFEVTGFTIPLAVELFMARDGRTAVMLAVTSVGAGAPGADGEDYLELLLEEANA